jgi:hypothetical protein
MVAPIALARFSRLFLVPSPMLKAMESTMSSTNWLSIGKGLSL